LTVRGTKIAPDRAADLARALPDTQIHGGGAKRR
jgi:hypothetical protein